MQQLYLKIISTRTGGKGEENKGDKEDGEEINLDEACDKCKNERSKGAKK
jgi:hypothetical protein